MSRPQAVDESPTRSRLTRIMGRVISGVGVILWINYLAYLPWPSWFVTPGEDSLGLIFYSLATAGAAFVAWGRIMSRMDVGGVSRETVMQASSLGFAMLAGMRLETALFPIPPFDHLQVLPLSEGLLFLLIAWVLHRRKRQ